MKYNKITGRIDEDYRIHLGREGLYHTLFGHRLTRKQRLKRDYIWRKLLKLYGLK